MKTIEMQEALRLVAKGTAVDAATRKRLQQERLRELVQYVRRNSPYFAALYAGVGEDFALTDLPSTEKPALLAHYDDWVTDPGLSLEGVLHYVGRPADDCSLLLGRYTALCTSGSTGSPLPMVRDDYHNRIHQAMMLQRLYKDIDTELLYASRHRMASVVHTSPTASSYNAYLRTIAQYPQTKANLLPLSVLDSIEQTVERLNDFQPEVLTGYASSLLLLALEKEKGHLHAPVKLVTNSAEQLTPQAAERIAKAFGCPVINNYCMTEGGEIAMTNGCRHLHLNEDWVIVEPVDAEKRPLPPDCTDFSEGLLITDLSNYVQPIIRYYVSDRVRIVADHHCPQSPLPILELDGRVMEPFSLCGKQFTMAAMVAKCDIWPGLLKYQIVQRSTNRMEVRGVCAADADPHAVLESLAQRLQEYFRQNGCTDATFTHSTEPLLFNPQGGKIPRYINKKD